MAKSFQKAFHRVGRERLGACQARHRLGAVPDGKRLMEIVDDRLHELLASGQGGEECLQGEQAIWHLKGRWTSGGWYIPELADLRIHQAGKRGAALDKRDQTLAEHQAGLRDG